MASEKPKEKKPYVPTPEQLALAAERKAKKQKLAEEKALASSSTSTPQVKILSRPWISLQSSHACTYSNPVRFMTWNLLAQTLVRRELFPTSNCLKAQQREGMIHAEILLHNADIMTMQEVDRLEKLLPMLETAGYAHTYAAGPYKKHGCLIAYKSDAYTQLHAERILYDEQDVRACDSQTGRRGSSFRTKNIASIVALQRNGHEGQGFIVATTHLFWHPRYTYERARQAGIMLREVIRFRKEINHPDWPCVLSGDFNFQPNDAAYKLFTSPNAPFTPSQERDLDHSRVVHVSIDPSVPVNAASKDAEEDEGGEESTAQKEEEEDEDRVIKNARSPLPEDGLLSNQELRNLFMSSLEPGRPLRSAYDLGQRVCKQSSNQPEVVRSGERLQLKETEPGAYEPEWTSYTHYWKTVLDYIFILDPHDKEATIVGYSQPPMTHKLQPGIPMKDVCGSDHVSLCAEITWSDRTPHAQ